jgi:hypothetical protein
VKREDHNEFEKKRWVVVYPHLFVIGAVMLIGSVILTIIKLVSG